MLRQRRNVISPGEKVAVVICLKRILGIGNKTLSVKLHVRMSTTLRLKASPLVKTLQIGRECEDLLCLLYYLYLKPITMSNKMGTFSQTLVFVFFLVKE